MQSQRDYFGRHDIQQNLIDEAHALGINISWMKYKYLVRHEYNSSTRKSKYVLLKPLSSKIVMALFRKVDKAKLRNKYEEMKEIELRKYLVIFSSVHKKYGGGFANFFAKELIELTKESSHEIRNQAELEHYGPGTPETSDDEEYEESSH